MNQFSKNITLSTHIHNTIGRSRSHFPSIDCQVATHRPAIRPITKNHHIAPLRSIQNTSPSRERREARRPRPSVARQHSFGCDSVRACLLLLAATTPTHSLLDNTQNSHRTAPLPVVHSRGTTPESAAPRPHPPADQTLAPPPVHLWTRRLLLAASHSTVTFVRAGKHPAHAAAAAAT